MANKITDTNNYSAIANSIRSKLGTQSTYTPSQMAAAIDSIPVTDIEALSVTDNGTYTAPTGTAYNPVTVNVPSSGGGEAEDGIIERTISGAYSNRTATKIGNYAFYNCSSLTEVSFQNATSIGNSAFCYCANLTELSFPNATYIGSGAFITCAKITKAIFPNVAVVKDSAFDNCASLSSISFPNATSIGIQCFKGCISLKEVSFPNVTDIDNYAFSKCTSLSEASFQNIMSIGNAAFSGCTRLIKLDISLVSSVPRLAASNAFSSTPIGGYSRSAGQYGSIFVPASLYESFRTASNWSYFSSRMVSV